MDVFLQEVHGYLLVVQDKVVGKLLYDSVAVSGLDPGAINANNNRLFGFHNADASISSRPAAVDGPPWFSAKEDIVLASNPDAVSLQCRFISDDTRQ